MNCKAILLLLISFSLLLGGCRIESGSNDEHTDKKETKAVQENDMKSKEEKTTALATMEMYNQLEKGMSYEEVKEIIGSEGKAATEEGDADMMYIWDGSYPNSFLSVSFKRNKLMSKTQMGLK
ncbi:hypothetical protein FZC78_12085 [Rossellomorea vietnamensis]|uniref:DUF3862 domain-containing protein n=1 Tax=Rossellomorea vietnamensis TaxID=218284 RepID=A0A5D4NRD1_9BACI|nr:hypothetical protein [Rossellomorea vietnamensis]TYS16717.1 hypothetical protein FZC78_12085 [Rossellomorea vietnamensis]